MLLYILHDGQETGPFSEEAARAELASGAVAAGDFAWHEGIADWQPLGDILPEVPEPAGLPDKVIESQASHTALATAKQKAFLSFFGLAVPADLSRDRASYLVNEALEDPHNAQRLTKWNEERLLLHPELFAADIQAKKENRANHFFELCQSAGSAYFSGVTKAHCQVLVGFLDVKFPHWDARESDAAEHYFFPAVAEKFPQLVTKTWRGRLQYAEGARGSGDLGRRPATARLRRPATSPLLATARGLILGGVILGGLYLANRTLPGSSTASPVEKTTGAAAVTPSAMADEALSSPTTTPGNLPVAEPLPPITPAEIPPPSPSAPPQVSAPLPNRAANADTMAALPPPPPLTTLPEPTPPVVPSALNSVPMAALPGLEPTAPLPPLPAAMPAPEALATLPPGAAAIPPLPANESPLVSAPSSKSNLLLTKPVEVQFTYGRLTLPPGTPVKLVARQGTTLKVSYQNSVLLVPLSSTDLE